MFSCKNKTSPKSRIVDDGVRKLLDVEKFKQCYSLSLKFPLNLFGCDLFCIDNYTVGVLVMTAQNAFQKLITKAIWTSITTDEIEAEKKEFITFFQLILGEMDDLDASELMQSMSRFYDEIPGFVTVVTQYTRYRLEDIDEDRYNLLHYIYEVHWYVLNILFALRQRCNSKDHCDGIFQSLLVSLIRLASLKFALTNKDELHTTDQFYCDCVRNVWLGILSLSTSGNEPLNFWDFFYKAIKMIQLKQEPRSVQLSNDFLFVTWLINGIASLYEYVIIDQQTSVESTVIKVEPDHTMIDSMVKEAGKSPKTEAEMRMFLLLLKPIYCRWWAVKYDFLLSLWEYFRKRLNSTFQLPNESFSRLACLDQLPTALIEQGRVLASKETFNALDTNTSSYKIFLSIYAFMVHHFSASRYKKTKVQLLFLRTALSISRTTFDTLVGQGVYNYSLLVFTLMASTHYQDDYSRCSKQFLQIKLDLPKKLGMNLEDSVQRTITTCLANTALLIRFCQSGFDKSSHLQHFIEDFNRVWIMYGDRIKPVLRFLACAMNVAFEKKITRGKELEEGDRKFISTWLARFLSGCSDAEREEQFRAFNRLFDCFRSKQPFRVADYDSIMQPFFENVLPYVKDVFIKIDKPCPIVAQLAANFTLFCLGQSFAEIFISLFSYFADNAKAHPVLRLQYTQIIVNSDRVDEIEPRLIIRCWAKYAILCPEQMREFSECVFAMAEFRALCEIPILELEEDGADPITLFFKFVGRRYRELEGSDSKVQHDMLSRMNGIFQQFDKWMPDPNIKLLRRICTVLASALKECGPLIFIRGNPACLYHVAFSHYFLPPCILTDTNVPFNLVQVMGKLWFRVMDALSQMDYAGEIIIKDHVSNMMVKWAPQFFKFRERKEMAGPYVLLITSRNENFVSFALERYVYVYIALQEYARPKPKADIALQLLLYALDFLAIAKDNQKIALFIKIIGTSTIEHAMMCKECPSQTVATEIVLTMLDIAKGISKMVKMELTACLTEVTKNHISFMRDRYFAFMFKLIDRNPEFIKSMRITLLEWIIDAERRMGFKDKNLRMKLAEFDAVIERSLIKLKRRNLEF